MLELSPTWTDCNMNNLRGVEYIILNLWSRADWRVEHRSKAMVGLSRPQSGTVKGGVNKMINILRQGRWQGWERWWWTLRKHVSSLTCRFGLRQAVMCNLSVSSITSIFWSCYGRNRNVPTSNRWRVSLIEDYQWFYATNYWYLFSVILTYLITIKMLAKQVVPRFNASAFYLVTQSSGLNA